jgi:hypothetical protein
MPYYTVGNTRVEIQDESNGEREFKHQFNKILVQLLSHDELVQHLKVLNIKYIDRGYFSHSRYINEDRVEENELMDAGVDTFGNDIILELNLAYCRIYFYKFGEKKFIQTLCSTLNHELIHYLHNSINNRTRLSRMAYLRLKDIYKKKYTEFEREGLENQLHMESLFDLMILFLDKLVEEGFAMFYQESKKDKIKFNDKYFLSNYAEARKSADICQKAFLELSAIKNKDFFIKKMSSIIHDEPFVTLEYQLGFHIVYALIYLDNENSSKSIDHIISVFITWYGKLRPKKIIKEYEARMLKAGRQPLIGLTHNSLINIKEIEKTIQGTAIT